jgi:hypothetical protein
MAALKMWQIKTSKGEIYHHIPQIQWMMIIFGEKK